MFDPGAVAERKVKLDNFSWFNEEYLLNCRSLARILVWTRCAIRIKIISDV